MADRQGRDLHDLLGWTGPLTWRQLTVWQAWLRADMDEPSRTDHYLMQLTAAMLREKDPSRLKLKFKWKRVVPGAGDGEPQSDEEATEWAMARWGAILGLRKDGTPSRRRKKNRGGEGG